MCYVSPFQGFGELGRRRTQVAGVPRVALRSTLGYLIMPRWGERSRGKNSGTVPGFFHYPGGIQGHSTSAGAAPALASFSSCQSW
jgi:hypothetical protein